MARKEDGRPVVVSVGGSILVPKEGEVTFVAKMAACLNAISLGSVPPFPLLVTVGGGEPARRYISWGRSLGGDEFTLDEMGIAVTRLNAQLLITALQIGGPGVLAQPAAQIPDAVRASRSHRIVVMGGTHPGHTTDAVAAMLATKVRAARLVNATSVDGVYDRDPRKEKGARRFHTMTYEDLLRLVTPLEYSAGPNVPFDPLGARILSKSRIPLLVVDGTELANLRRAIRGEKFKGTTVT